MQPLPYAIAAPSSAPASRGLEELQWRSDSIDAFIREALELVRELDAVLATLKDNVRRTQVGRDVAWHGAGV